jgi:hypothetical protein
MEFTLTIRFPDGTGQRESHDLQGMKDSLWALAKVLDALVPGETVEIKRVS